MSEEKIPPKPAPQAELLFRHGGGVVGLVVDYRQTGTDTADTYWKLTLNDGHELDVLKSSYSEFLYFFPHYTLMAHRCIAHLKPELAEQCKAWDAYCKKHSLELAEYNRLKAKFGSTV